MKASIFLLVVLFGRLIRVLIKCVFLALEYKREKSIDGGDRTLDLKRVKLAS